MPTILRLRNFRVAVYTRDEHEPPHVHVIYPGGTAAILLDEHRCAGIVREVEGDVSAHELAWAADAVARNFDILIRAWERFHR